MFEQAAGFGALAAISPSALFVMAVFLASANPRRTALAYVAGAAIMTVTMAVGMLFIIRAAGLDQPRQHDPLYGLRLGLGVIALAIAGVIARRRPRSPQEQEKRGEGFIAGLTARPGVITAFAAGLILFVPSATFVAAVQVVASARAAVVATVVALVIVVLLTVLVVWLPLVTFLVAPDKTTGALRKANDWLRAHGRQIVVCALAGVGAALVINGCLGLAS
jgi:Na+/melibiose symporter-like transporter